MNIRRIRNILLPTLLVLFVLQVQVYSQCTITGYLTDKETGEPIEGAHIFVASTTAGTLTEKNGSFSLSNVPCGNIELFVSHLSYEAFSKKMDISESQSMSLQISISSKAIEIEEINVTALAGKKRSKYLKKFEKAFLGTSRNASKCDIKNPEVIHLELGVDGSLIAKASEMIEIENRSTGFRVLFLLDKFNLLKETVAYSGKPLFIPLDPISQKEAKQWIIQREVTYNGSMPHFLTALRKGNLAEEGFEMYHAIQNNEQQFKTIASAPVDKVLNESDGKAYLYIPEFLKVIYTREKDDRRIQLETSSEVYDQLGRPEERASGLNLVENKSRHQVSYLYARKNKVPIDKQGYVASPELLLEYGYWAWERVGDLLPREFADKSKVPLHSKVEEQQTPGLNGFYFSNLLIPGKEIRKGGPPKDGIPSIDNPVFSTIGLGEMEYVLGVYYNGIAKAYPVNILNWHEVVNDHFAKKAVVITYCPLCGSGMSFDAEIGGVKRSFGVSGLLYNSDVLLYDRETESLWSQILSKAVSGKESGQELKYIPTHFTTWGEWKRLYPGSLVLTTETGVNRNYTHSAYEGYEDTPKLMFPVSESSDLLPAKEKVLGIEVNGRFRAYPFSQLKKQNKIQESWSGKRISIEFNKATETARATLVDGGDLKAVTLYWFAWYAFHSGTSVYRN